MILEAIISVFCTMMDGLLSGLSLAQIPTQGIQILSTLAGYGSYVVGADLLLCFASVVATWAVIQMVVGIGLFVWRLLPLT